MRKALMTDDQVKRHLYKYQRGVDYDWEDKDQVKGSWFDDIKDLSIGLLEEDVLTAQYVAEDDRDDDEFQKIGSEDDVQKEPVRTDPEEGSTGGCGSGSLLSITDENTGFTHKDWQDLFTYDFDVRDESNKCAVFHQSPKLD